MRFDGLCEVHALVKERVSNVLWLLSSPPSPLYLLVNLCAIQFPVLCPVGGRTGSRSIAGNALEEATVRTHDIEGTSTHSIARPFALFSSQRHHFAPHAAQAAQTHYGLQCMHDHSTGGGFIHSNRSNHHHHGWA
ncbi:hypothetical protein Naga_100032g25 [Nannochloropsis gaditana]|uniref:Uncharacterized protein n=1 Tax=Nannochloropsis gaditana TaxID=72520 RepID=W7TPU6_9STRA|nr:hypothetical protein Naga_100032g25 [Nannochloropsis gaditana]